MVKLTRSGFSWCVTPLDVNLPARTYKAMLPHLRNILDPAPPTRTILVTAHKAEKLACSSTRKSFVTKYSVSIHFGGSKATTPPASSPSPVWNCNRDISGVGHILSITVFQKKSLLLRIDRKLVGSIDIALTDGPLRMDETWFNLPEGRILLTIRE